MKNIENIEKRWKKKTQQEEKIKSLTAVDHLRWL